MTTLQSAQISTQTLYSSDPTLQVGQVHLQALYASDPTIQVGQVHRQVLIHEDDTVLQVGQVHRQVLIGESNTALQVGQFDRLILSADLPPTYTPNVVIGFCFATKGQIVRPVMPQETGSRTGPAQGETRRGHMFTALLLNTQGISFGTTFTHLQPAQLAATRNGPIYPLTSLFSGVHQDTLNDDYSFDGMLCWQIIRPYPATVVNIGGWLHTQER